MIKEAINRILELAKVEIMEVNGFQYATKSLNMIQNPTPEPIKATTLTALVDYIKSGTDSQINSNRPLIIHVVSPWNVTLESSLRDDAERECFFNVEAQTPSITFGRFIDTENFNIMLQSNFVNSSDKAVLLQVVGTIQEENVGTIGDDGVTQTVVAKSGVSTKANIIVPNPVNLAPYRTFPEIEQPFSNFIFRMKNGPQAALFEADGGAWKNEAMKRIKDWLESQIHPKIDSERKYSNITIIA